MTVYLVSESGRRLDEGSSVKSRDGLVWRILSVKPPCDTEPTGLVTGYLGNHINCTTEPTYFKCKWETD